MIEHISANLQLFLPAAGLVMFLFGTLILWDIIRESPQMSDRFVPLLANLAFLAMGMLLAIAGVILVFLGYLIQGEWLVPP